MSRKLKKGLKVRIICSDLVMKIVDYAGGIYKLESADGSATMYLSDTFIKKFIPFEQLRLF